VLDEQRALRVAFVETAREPVERIAGIACVL
jgi:hypothetical protein